MDQLPPTSQLATCCHSWRSWPTVNPDDRASTTRPSSVAETEMFRWCRTLRTRTWVEVVAPTGVGRALLQSWLTPHAARGVVPRKMAADRIITRAHGLCRMLLSLVNAHHPERRYAI